ncbi:sugar transferase [Planococcus sp. X10-3]|uniref:sugar transferase n=1 Tax=Planococcus sp. X10-3 TaxID=3061240 RepID=UPI003BB1DC19
MDENYEQTSSQERENVQSGIYNISIYIFEALLILITLPITAVLTVVFALLVILESRGEAFYSQTRSGKDGQTFKIYKLRSMTMDAEKDGPQWALSNDNRITGVGKFIRKTRIDELPQLWNVLRGDMSIIGPRPERPEFIEEFEKETPNFRDRLAVKPGLTGWAQINGGYELTPAEKLEYDLYYIRNQNILLDLKIMLFTVRIVLTGHGAR